MHESGSPLGGSGDGMEHAHVRGANIPKKGGETREETRNDQSSKKGNTHTHTYTHADKRGGKAGGASWAPIDRHTLLPHTFTLHDLPPTHVPRHWDEIYHHGVCLRATSHGNELARSLSVGLGLCRLGHGRQHGLDGVEHGIARINVVKHKGAWLRAPNLLLIGRH